MSKELDLAVTVIAYVQFTEYLARLIEQERVKESWKQRTDEDKDAFAEVMDSIVPAGRKLLANIQKLAKED